MRQLKRRHAGRSGEGAVQDRWAAEVIFERGSTVDGFDLRAFRKMKGRIGGVGSHNAEGGFGHSLLIGEPADFKVFRDNFPFRDDMLVTEETGNVMEVRRLVCL